MPPECFLIRPDPGSQVSTGPGAIAIFAKDTLSGIYGEDSYTVRLNNVRQIVAYDPHENCMYCDLPMSTKPGPDTLFFSVTDQAGNVTENTAVFYIPERSKESP